MRLPEPAVCAVFVVLLPAFLCGSATGDREPASSATAYVGDPAAVQQMLDQTRAAGGGPARWPAGRYRIDRPLEVPAGVCLAGAGARSAGLS